ncbi:hypothetical protein VQL36_20315 [Chengkuizengella sp. SCS-71B]|uniref:hypothetical protein n=1 Tax=Chengkuizengella sp. SCS-71B TaxID=3115290 RepID=UPI0032C20EEB
MTNVKTLNKPLFYLFIMLMIAVGLFFIQSGTGLAETNPDQDLRIKYFEPDFNTGELVETVESESGIMSESISSRPPLEDFLPLNSYEEGFPSNTYNSRTTLQGLDHVDFIPVKFKVEDSEYATYLDTEDLFKINDRLNKKDPSIDTFIGIYDPDTGNVVQTFPPNPPDTLILLLNKNSYYAQGITVKVENWWDLYTQDFATHGGRSQYRFMETRGITEGYSLELGWSVGLEAAVKTQMFGSGTTFTLSVGHQGSRTWEQTLTQSTSLSKHFNFGEISGGTPYVFGLYEWITRYYTNYNTSYNFVELGQDIDYFIHQEDVQDFNMTYQTGTLAAVEIPEQPAIDPSLPIVHDFSATGYRDQVSVTLKWDTLVEGDLNRIDGYKIFKEVPGGADHLIAIVDKNSSDLIISQGKTKWKDYGIRPNSYNTNYYVRTYKDDPVLGNKMSNKSLIDPANLKVNRVVNFTSVQGSCGINFSWTDPATRKVGEQTLYQLWHRDLDTETETLILKTASETGINYVDQTIMNSPNSEFWVIKEVIYAGDSLTSTLASSTNRITVNIPDGAYLFTNGDFTGECIRADVGIYNVSDLDFPNDELSSILIAGDYYVTVYDDIDQDSPPSRIKTIFKAHQFLEDVLGPGDNAVSSLIVREKLDGVYLFTGPSYTGYYNLIYTPYDGHRWITDFGIPDDALSSFKIVGDLAPILQKGNDITTRKAFSHSVEDLSAETCSSGTCDNFADGIMLWKGEGVWLFNGSHYDHSYDFGHIAVDPGQHIKQIPRLNTIPNDTLSSILFIGEDYGAALYDAHDYNGTRFATSNNFNELADLPDYPMHNRVSSIKVFKDGLFLFDDRAWKGDMVRLGVGDYDNLMDHSFNNRASSMFLTPDYKYDWFENYNFDTSSAHEIDKNIIHGYIGDDGEPIRDNTLSSIRVYKDRAPVIMAP